VKKICVITGARSEYGLLAPLMRELKAARGVKLQVLVTGMHLSPKFGNTWREITADGFGIDARAKFPLPDAVGTAAAIGRAVEGIAGALEKLKPDLVVLLGDRFEAFAAATAAYTLKTPIAHLHGGEITAGVFDEAFRHAITKMSALHFTSTEEYRKRVIQLGENPATVFNVGAIGLDNIRLAKFMGRGELSASLGLALGEDLACVTFHPAMFETASPQAQLKELFRALDRFPRLQLVFTLPNADKGSGALIGAIKSYAKKNSGRVSAFASLGVKRYLSLLKCSRVVIGNSSSGIIEAPSLKIPTVNIGARQEGRTRPASVIDCAPSTGAIALAVRKALSPAFAKNLGKPNPYGRGGTAPAIARILLRELKAGVTLKKNFFDVRKILRYV
jgi:UDP-hydrolysing UDP-N-acetyl-D-glucosamine 2-epimerase